MAHYAVPLAGTSGNVIYGKDGSIWVNYLLVGINVNPYNAAKVSAAQGLNDELFTSLSSIESTDFLLLGLKNRERPEDIMARCVNGVPELNGGQYPELVKQFNIFYRKLVSGELTSFDRVYWLSVAMPTSRSLTDKVASKVVVTDPHEGVTSKSVREFNKAVFDAIPDAFMPRPTTPEHLRWVFDRSRLRGLEVTFEPNSLDAPMKFSPKSFPQIEVDGAADRESTMERFISELSEKLNEQGKKALKEDRKGVENSFRKNFRSIHRGRMLSVSNVETSNPKFPDGYVSYQSLMGISAAPNELTTGVNTFTYIVDQAIGCDADFALRFVFDSEAVSKNTASRALADLKSENASNSRDELDAEEYGETIGDVREMHAAIRAESNPVGMKVAALFSFAHPDHRYLERRSSTLSKTFANNGFTTYRAVGGQEDMWKQMMPGVPRSRLTEDLMMITTAYLFGGCLPVRKTVVGDSQGVPVAINTENALGQIVLWDILNSTDKGNASVTVCGAQGAGKSYLIKEMLGYMLDLNRYVYLIDQHKHGEYEVFASTLSNAFVFDVTGRTASLDPLKTYPSEDGTAAQVFMDLWLPLLGIEVDEPEATVLSRLVKWEYRKPRKLFSTRAFIEHIRTNPNNVSDKLAGKFSFWGEQSYCSGLIDPIDKGVVTDLPAFSEAHSNCVVFRTHNLSVYRGNDLREAEPSEKYAAVMYNAIARIATYHFSKIKGACAFFGDELHFLDGNDRVLDRLIRTPDRTGRKDGNFIVGGSQLAADFGSQYDMIKRKFILRQETRDNAIDALEWGEVPATEFLVARMLEDTSPPDPNENNMPTRGREGEGWFNDGSGNIARIKVLPHMRADRGRMADTTSSRMVRASELSKES